MIRAEVNRLAVLARADHPCVKRFRDHPEQAGQHLPDSVLLAVDDGDYDLAHVVCPGLLPDRLPGNT